jgi:hypothetical protein
MQDPEGTYNVHTCQTCSAKYALDAKQPIQICPFFFLLKFLTFGFDFLAKIRLLGQPFMCIIPDS